MRHRLTYLHLLFTSLFCGSEGLWAAGYPLPEGGDLIGEIRLEKISRSETLLDVARRYDVGQEEMRLANTGIDRWLPDEGEPVLIPSQHILPDARRRGLVLNLPEMRLYHFPEPGRGGSVIVNTYPVSIGRMDWTTPLGETKIIRRQHRPSWRPPASIRQEAAAAGEPMPEVVPPGPDNPLGDYALRLARPGYLIHGTNKPYGVGMRVTHGCIRLLPEDIAELFDRVTVGAPVQILNQPVKTGWQDGLLYIEVHPPLEEDVGARGDLLRFALERVYAELEAHPAVLDGEALRRAVEETHGVPVAISRPGQTGRNITHPLFR